MSQLESAHTVCLANGIEIDLIASDNRFQGIGAVRAPGNQLLRSSRRPMFVVVRTPDGVLLTDYSIAKQHITSDQVTLEFAASAIGDGIQEWMVHEVRNRYRTDDWTESPRALDDTTLKLVINPITRIIGDRSYTGFSYQYFYDSTSLPIYKILDRGTWEIGGRAIGNEFWMRNCFVPSVVPIVSEEQFHSTEWYAPSATNPNIFQFLPLQTELQGFSFTASDNGTLVTWVNRASHVRSLFEKPRGKNEIVHWHEHCGDLSNHFGTAPVEVLFAPGSLDRVGRFNAYEAVKELVHDTLHSEIGMRRERITTYSQIEEWGNADIKRYASLGLPKVIEAGAKTVYIANHFENNMNTFGASNMCCTVDYKFAETVGEENIRDFCCQAHAAGVKVEMWANTSISSLTYIANMRSGKKARIDFLPTEGSVMDAFKNCPNALVRNASGAIEADHYAPVFCVMNLREPAVRDYWLRRWKDANKVGLDGIFLDSSFNLSSDKFHWGANTEAESAGATADQTDLLGFYRPEKPAPQAILSQYRAHLDLMVKMQAIGYYYCNEDVGVFGTHRHGPDVAARLTTLPLWTDCICTFDVPSVKMAGADIDDVFFKGLAYRMMWSLNWDIQRDRLTWHHADYRTEDDAPTAWQISLMKAYTEVEPLLMDREILPGEAGVVYTARGQRVLWAFTDLAFALDSATQVRDVLSGNVTKTDNLDAKSHRLYVIG